jgi:hypothetical protein
VPIASNLAAELRFIPMFGDVLVETLRRSAVSHNDWHQLFVTIRNYNTHGPEYCWRGNVQWFDYSNNGMELMVPKYTADFLAQMLDVLIQRKFDIKDEYVYLYLLSASNLAVFYNKF